MMSRDANISLVRRMPALYRLMRETNVTMYTVDPAGLGVMEQYLTRTAQSLPGLMHASEIVLRPGEDWFNLPGPPRPADLARRVSTVSLDFLKTAAANTGGFAITDSNDFEAGVRRLFAENASYYIVGFTLPPGRKPGSLHRLEVKVKRPDVQVRTRSGYEVPEQPAPAPARNARCGRRRRPPPPPTPLLAAPIPMGALPMRLVLTPLLSGTGDKRDVAVMLWMDGIPGTASQSFDVELRAFTMEGGAKLGERRTGQTAESKTGNSTFELLARIALPPGRYEIRAAARLAPANLAGSVFGDLVVPEPPKNGLALSGVLLDAVPAVRAGPLDVFKGRAAVGADIATRVPEGHGGQDDGACAPGGDGAARARIARGVDSGQERRRDLQLSVSSGGHALRCRRYAAQTSTSRFPFTRSSLASICSRSTREPGTPAPRSTCASRSIKLGSRCISCQDLYMKSEDMKRAEENTGF